MYVKRGKNEKRCPESNPQSIYKNPKKKNQKKKERIQRSVKEKRDSFNEFPFAIWWLWARFPFLLFCIEEVLWCRGICIHFLCISYPLSSKRKMCPDRRQHRRKPLMYWLRLHLDSPILWMLLGHLQQNHPESLCTTLHHPETLCTT